MYDNHAVDLADHEYSVTVPEMYAGDPAITIYMSAHGGGTVGEAYAHNGWAYAVTAGGSEIYAGDDLRSGGMSATHEEMARTLASFLAAAGESLHYSGDRSEYANEYAGEVREFLEAEYERLADFSTDPDDLDS